MAPSDGDAAGLIVGLEVRGRGLIVHWHHDHSSTRSAPALRSFLRSVQRKPTFRILRLSGLLSTAHGQGSHRPTANETS